MDEIEQAFRAYFRSDPYPYQTRVASTLLNGKNVLLRAPTGSGKTKAALFPFLYARTHGIAFADRLIFAFPLVTLAQAQYLEVQRQCGCIVPDLRVTIQTGARREDEYFTGDVIFTTIDQLLSAYIGVPVSLPGKFANLPAAALLGAYVVFDEVHLLEPGRALTTALDLAARLVRHTRVLMMTATLSADAATMVAERLRAEQILVSAEEAQAIPSQADKKRRYIWHDDPITADAIVEWHHDRSIVVVNTVDRAQALARELRDLLAAVGTEVLLLHSRFLASDRRRIEALLLDRLGEQAKGNVILVATQVVEVGLNISCTVMHVEVAPANAVLQRAGRCVRFAQPKSGTVHVYALPQNERDEPRYGPYSEQRHLVDATSAAFRERPDATIDASDEQLLVDAVHAQSDADMLRQLVPSVRAEQVRVAQQHASPSCVRDLVRAVDAVTIYVHPEPAQMGMDGPLEGFSLHRGVVAGLARSLEETNQLAALYTVEFPPSDRGATPEAVWRPLKEAAETKRVLALAIRSSHAAYSPDIGLTFHPGGDAAGTFVCPPLTDQRRQRRGHGYHKEYYREHIRLVVDAHDSAATASPLARIRLEQSLRLPAGSSEALSHLVAQLHDVGKLTRRWQDAAWHWQVDLARGDHRDGLLAHMTFDPADAALRAKWEAGLKTGRYQRGPHAPEGAFAVIPVLVAEVQKCGVSAANVPGVVQALFSAIVRHHSAETTQLSSFELGPEAGHAVGETLGAPVVQLAQRPSPAERAEFGNHLTTPTAEVDGDWYWLYLYAARRLRLADQEGTRAGGPDR